MFEMTHSIDLASIVKELKLETVYLPMEAEEIMVSLPDVGRPGLPLAGFFEHFEAERVQIIGMVLLFGLMIYANFNDILRFFF